MSGSTAKIAKSTSGARQSTSVKVNPAPQAGLSSATAGSVPSSAAALVLAAKSNASAPAKATPSSSTGSASSSAPATGKRKASSPAIPPDKKRKVVADGKDSKNTTQAATANPSDAHSLVTSAGAVIPITGSVDAVGGDISQNPQREIDDKKLVLAAKLLQTVMMYVRDQKNDSQLTAWLGSQITQWLLNLVSLKKYVEGNPTDQDNSRVLAEAQQFEEKMMLKAQEIRQTESLRSVEVTAELKALFAIILSQAKLFRERAYYLLAYGKTKDFLHQAAQILAAETDPEFFMDKWVADRGHYWFNDDKDVKDLNKPASLQSKAMSSVWKAMAGLPVVGRFFTPKQKSVLVAEPLLPGVTSLLSLLNSANSSGSSSSSTPVLTAPSTRRTKG